MIFYNITASMPVKPDWASISGDLKAGTPLSIGGKVANDDAAFGLVQEDTAHGAEYVKVVYAGVADLSGASKSCGSAISDDAVQAMNGLTFIYGGKIYNVVPSGLPDYSEASDGDALSIEDGEPAWKEPSGGSGVTTLYYNTDYMDPGMPWYFSTDPTFEDEDATVEVADAESMIEANPGAVVFADAGGVYAPTFAKAPSGEAVEFTAFSWNSSTAIFVLRAVAFATDSSGNSITNSYIEMTQVG